MGKKWRKLPGKMRKMISDIKRYADAYDIEGLNPELICAGLIMVCLEQLKKVDASENPDRFKTLLRLAKNLNSQMAELQEDSSDKKVSPDELQEMINNATD